MIVFLFFLSNKEFDIIEEMMKHYEFERAVSIIDSLMERYKDTLYLKLLYMKGKCYEALSNKEQALHIYGEILKEVPFDTVAFPSYWRLKFETESSENQERLKKEFLSGVREASSLYDNIKAIYLASIYMEMDTTFIDSLKSIIKREYPDSKLCFDIEGEDFYDGLYPIWNDDKLKVDYLVSFLKRATTDYWRNTAYRWLLYSLLKLDRKKEVLKWIDEWLKQEDENPEVLNYISSILLRMDTLYRKSLFYSKQALDFLNGFNKPPHLSQEEWRLIIKVLPGNIKMNLSRSYHKLGVLDSAIIWIEKAIKETELDEDVEATLSPYYTHYGILLLEKGDTAKAKQSFIKALIYGDRGNRWTSKAESIMVSIMGTEEEVLNYARELYSYSGPVFEERTEDFGLKGVKGSRVAFGDFNNDGFPDLLIDGSRLFKNIGGKKFLDVTEKMKIDVKGKGGVWFDFDRDGYLDIFVSGAGTNPDKILKNIKGRKFKDITSRVWSEPDTFPTEGVGILDFDRDGYPDIYLANYENWEEHIYYKDKLLHNIRGKELEDVTDSMGIVPPFGEDLAGRGVSCIDFDNDGWTDIYVSNYRLTENFLWKNLKGRRFLNVAPELEINGVNVERWFGHSIGSVWGDIDNDGDFDLFVANLAHPRYIEFSDRSILYENRDGRFVDIRKEAGIKYAETHSDPAFVDFDNDGLLDLYITSVYPDRRSYLYWNRGGRRFLDVTYLSGSRIFNGWGSGFADINNDGYIDMVLRSQKGLRVFINRGNGNHYIKVRIKGRDCDTKGLGCRITLRYGDVTQTREVISTRGTTSQDGYTVHFGTGRWDGEVELELRFPSGRVKRIETGVDRTVVIEE